ncbi:MFS transporter [Saccharopolyspora sp. WRP15-2]|uniref:MFS transporter n=1 Tax=Saccharopolyspora oryzae TaxID=2997343 RepID=A0ABT4US46_9PSEU|nr:MFS transporter [Saccharopolyspora oryzae]MDA3624076.1 MFS transporter [Saccharopolyspora oryzae]
MRVQGRISPAVESAAPAKGRGRVLFATIAAQSIEYYDFLIYGTAASLIFSAHFFPAANPVAGILASFATFAVGFAGRPLGAAVFGHFGDKFGRKPALLVAMMLMAVSSMLIGLLPTYATIGVVAPVLLVVLRLAQGISVGGHFGGATLMSLENAPPNRRGLFGALPQLGVVVGMVGGTLIFLLISNITTPEQFAAWGWRIPFLLSFVMFPVAYFVHRYIEDTPEFRRADDKLAESKRSKPRSSVVQVLRNPKQVLLVAFTFIPATISFYVIVTGLLHYATSDLGISRNTMLSVVMLSMVAFAVGTIGFALLSDIVGRRAVYAGGALFAGAWGFALFPLVETGSFPLMLLAACVGQLAVGAMFGPGTALFAEAFPPSVRYSGASIGNQLANILGAGFAPFIMVSLLAATHTSVSVSLYMLAGSLVSLVAISMLRVSTGKAAAAS